MDGLLQFGELRDEEREVIGRALSGRGRSLQDMLADASTMLSGLSQAAGMVIAPKSDGAIKHIEFAPLGAGRALVILVGADGQVENRVIEVPPGMPPSALTRGGELPEYPRGGAHASRAARARGRGHGGRSRPTRHAGGAEVVQAGLATWSDAGRGGALIVRGQARLLADVTQIENLAAIQMLFERLETQETMLRLLELAEQSEGGADFYWRGERAVRELRGFRWWWRRRATRQGGIVGAIGVIGPTRINYGRVIPVVDYTARIIGRLLG